MRVLFFPVGGEPHTMDIDCSLESMQAVVGDDIQIAPLDQGLDLVCGEHGKFNGAEPNRAVPELHDVIYGPFFIMGHDDDGQSRGLSELELALARRRLWSSM